MRVAYLDCFSGISGDMLLGALVDAGADVEDLRPELEKLSLAGWELNAERVERAGIAATHVRVVVREPQRPRTLADVLAIVEASQLPVSDRAQIAAVFRRLAEAEAKVHGVALDALRLHDVGAVDAIVDVAGAVAGLRLLGIERLYCSPLPAGAGEVRGPHGVLPVPAPATLELLAGAGAPLRTGGEGELVTPTGAAIVAALARFERPDITLERIGYGAGSRDPEGRPNVLRLWLGATAGAPAARAMVLLETNVDDMTGEALAYAQERLLAAGAADAWLTAIQMKKGRPAVTVSVLCREEEEEKFVRLLLRETSTLGVRVRAVHRWEAERELFEFECSLGPAAAKIKRLAGEPPRVAPEYEPCRRLAEASGLPLAEVYRIVQAEAEQSLAG
jgi:hypothetical protein